MISVVPPSVPCVEGGHGPFHQGGVDIYQFVFWVRWEAEDQIEFQMCSVDCVDCVDMTPSPPSPPAACQQTMHWKAFTRLTSWEWYVGRVMLEYLILIFCLKIYIFFFLFEEDPITRFARGLQIDCKRKRFFAQHLTAFQKHC